MSYQTVEVELEDGRVRPRRSESLPAKARALLTILESNSMTPSAAPPASGAGLQRFLAAPDFRITPEQFRASMEADLFEQ
jgi:hypothetical protein